MRLVACVKQVPDSEAKVTGLADRPSIDERDISFVVNPYDEYALEAAVRVRECAGEGEVLVLSVGPPRAEEALRRCLAAGAGSAARLWDECLEGADGAVIAQLLARALERVGFDLVFCGRLAIDDAAGEIGGRVAELLGVAHATAVSALALKDGGVVEREVDDGLEVVRLPLPAVLTAQKGLNQPRYPAIPAIMKARRLPIEQWTSDALGIGAEELAELSRSALVSLSLVQTARRRRRIEGEPDAVARELALLLPDAGALSRAYEVLWWSHLACALAVLAWLPFSKLAHVILRPPSRRYATPTRARCGRSTSTTRRSRPSASPKWRASTEASGWRSRRARTAAAAKTSAPPWRQVSR